MTSPGTSSSESKLGFMTPSRMQRAFSDCIFLRAESAEVALFSCHTPTMAFNIRMSKITKGSTNAVMPLSPPFSKKARMKDRTAERSRI